MSSNVACTPGVLIGVAVLFMVVENLLSITWNKTYFTRGIPVFARRIPVALPGSSVPSAVQLEAQFRSTYDRSLLFQEIDRHTFGFREDLEERWLFTRAMMMHGVLVFDHQQQAVVVKGFLNWSNVCFPLMIVGIELITATSFPCVTLLFVLFLIFGVGRGYFTQSDQYSRVAAFSAQSWSRADETGTARA